MIDIETAGAPVARVRTAEELQAARQASPAIVWVRITAPDEEDWTALTGAFSFHPLAVEDARKQEQRAKMDAYEGYAFISVRTWSGADPHRKEGERGPEIDIFYGPGYLITICAERLPVIDEARRRWVTGPESQRRDPTYPLYHLLDTIIDSLSPVLDAFDDQIEEIEDQVYESSADLDIGPALQLKKRLLLFRQTVAPLRDVVNQLLRSDTPPIPREALVYYQDAYDHTLRLLEQVDLHRDILSGALEATLAQVSNRMNQVMKTLTVLSTILMSVTLIAGIYGMNFKRMPELEWEWGYPAALGAMALIAVVLFVVFRRKRWI